MRIFNVSHHKCGTTSVHHALEILGYKSYHWFNPDHLLKIHLEGRVWSDPMLREDNTAWNDLPITLMYRALYEAFPAETFLFIRRDPVTWIESLRRHMAGWTAPLAVHTLVYGYPMTNSNFDQRVCLRAYERICGDILDFFHGKPNFHLIEFDHLSWKTVCPAVEKPEPSIPFPWENRTISSV